jgi:hypothetical protein
MHRSDAEAGYPFLKKYTYIYQLYFPCLMPIYLSHISYSQSKRKNKETQKTKQKEKTKKDKKKQKEKRKKTKNKAKKNTVILPLANCTLNSPGIQSHWDPPVNLPLANCTLHSPGVN